MQTPSTQPENVAFSWYRLGVRGPANDILSFMVTESQLERLLVQTEKALNLHERLFARYSELFVRVAVIQKLLVQQDVISNTELEEQIAKILEQMQHDSDTAVSEDNKTREEETMRRLLEEIKGPIQ